MNDLAYLMLTLSVDENARKLVAATREARDLGIAQCRPGAKYKDIGNAIE